MTAAQGRWEEFCLYVRAGLTSQELTEDDIKELFAASGDILQGVPTANHAIKEARSEIEIPTQEGCPPQAAFLKWIPGRRDWTRTNDPHHVKVVL